ncbi:MAG: YlxR family protein [Anaerolineae bacterium]
MDASGSISAGKQAGRGAYVHVKLDCWQAALTGGRLAHALKVPQILTADQAGTSLRGCATEGR